MRNWIHCQGELELSFLPSPPPLLTHLPPPTTPASRLKHSKWPAQRFVFSFFLLYLDSRLTLVIVALFARRRRLRSKPHVNRQEVCFLSRASIAVLTIFVFLSSGKAPRKQLATKAARKTAQVNFSLTIVDGVANIYSNYYFFFSFSFINTIDRRRRCQEASQVPPRYCRSS